MALKTIRVPVTVHNGKQYVAPGTEVEMEEQEANRLIGQYGEYGSGGSLKLDPGSTAALTLADQASLEELNKQASINQGHGRGANKRDGAQRPQSSPQQLAELPGDDELERMKKEELQAMAAERNVAIADGDTKAEIIAKMRAK